MFKHLSLAPAMTLPALTLPAMAATQTIDLAGDDNTGYLAAINIKNDVSEAGAISDLPDYAVAPLTSGLFTSIVAEPLSADSSYTSSLFTDPVTNQTISDADFATRSSGVIEYDDSSLTGIGTEQVPVDAVVVNAAGFSPLGSVHNNNNNAGWDYLISVTDIAGAGLTFQDGDLVSIDLTANVSILPRFGGTFAFGSSYDGSLNIAGNQFAFDVDVIQNNTTIFGPLTDTQLIFNRSGTIADVVPEPGVALIGLALGVGLLRVRPRSLDRA
ncbi:MAG: hypothetical protein AAGB29_00760 [Planctomycetota bacterium]